MSKDTFDIRDELKHLPEAPGVYIMRGAHDEILYVGKAKNLKKRVKQYFGSPAGKSPRILRMITLIDRFEYKVVDSEDEALILENDLIKRYQPKYNTLLKDDKTYPFIKITLAETYPRVTMARKVESDGAGYYGPYTSASTVRDIIALANRVFRLRNCSALPARPCLYYHLGQCMAPCTGEVSEKEYKKSVTRAIDFIRGNYAYVERYLRYRMRCCSESTEYEKAMEARDLLRDIAVLKKSEEREERKQSAGPEELAALLGIDPLIRIESYDISAIQGCEAVGSMVVFCDGAPRRKDYRRFRIREVDGPDDYASMREVLRRRFSHIGDESFPPLPDLILMDGGKGQVHIALEVLAEFGLDIPVAGMVKDDRHRTRGLIYGDTDTGIVPSSAAFRFITRIQDETHRSAISYHRSLRSKDTLSSELSDIPQIGPVRQKALLRYFGDIDRIKNADPEELIRADGMNAAAARSVFDHFHGVG